VKTFSLRRLSYAVVVVVFVFLMLCSAFLILSLNNLSLMAEHARLEAIPKALDRHQKARIIEQMRAFLDVMLTTRDLKKIDDVEEKFVFLSTHMRDRYLDSSLQALMRHIPMEARRLASKARTIVAKNNEIVYQKQKIDIKIETLRPLVEQTQATLWLNLRASSQRDRDSFILYKRMETLMGTFDKMALSLSQIMILQTPQAVENEQSHYRAMANLLLYLKPRLPVLSYQKELDDLIQHFSRLDYLFDLKQENTSFLAQLSKEHLALNQNLSSLQNQLTQTGIDLAKRVTDALEYQAREGFLASMIVFLILGALFFLIAFILIYGIVKPMTRASYVLRNLHACDPKKDLMHSDLTEMESINQGVIQLASAMKATEEANVRLITMAQLQSTFTATVSHELRTPLTSICGFLHIIQKDLKTIFRDTPSSKYTSRVISNVEIIQAESERLSLLINDVLDMTSLSFGRMVWRDEETQPAEVIRYTLAAMKGQRLQHTHVVLEQDIHDPLPTLRVDPHRLQQVLMNLLHNAYKFTEKGRIILKCWSENNRVYFSVQDTGMGIPKKDFDMIFEQFQQSGSLKDKPRGTGLGLAICRQIIEHYGGLLTVSSEVGKGSTFTFFIGHNDPK
jgi:signal transduction histidine kinase